MIESRLRVREAEVAVRTTLPVGPPRGIVQILHGMAEHAARYDRTARDLADAGFVVVVHDQRGHGQTSPDSPGHLADRDGWSLLVEDAVAVGAAAREAHPGIPLVLLGHSMGSLLARTVVQEHPTAADALVLSGTVADPGPVRGAAAAALARSTARIVGATRQNRVMDRLVNGRMNRGFRPARTDFDWLSRDEAEVDAYVADPACGFVCSGAFYVDLFTGLRLVRQRSRTANVRPDMPIHIIAGDRDPVGDNGAAVSALSADYRRVGVRVVTTRLYRGARHEVFNETNRDEVIADLLAWLDTHVPDVPSGDVIQLRPRSAR